jgi:hypothetical protein
MTRAIESKFSELGCAAGSVLLALTLGGYGAKPPLGGQKQGRATQQAEETPRGFEVAQELLVPPPPPRTPGKGQAP